MNTNEYKQEDTRKVLSEMSVASRRTSNPIVANTLNRARDRMAEMESLIFQLKDDKDELIRDNELMNQQLEKLENDLANARTRGGDNFNYKLFVKAFCESGKPFQKFCWKNTKREAARRGMFRRSGALERRSRNLACRSRYSSEPAGKMTA